MAEQQTAAALANDLEKFLKAFKDRDGMYKYFDRINNMMALGGIVIGFALVARHDMTEGPSGNVPRQWPEQSRIPLDGKSHTPTGPLTPTAPTWMCAMIAFSMFATMS